MFDTEFTEPTEIKTICHLRGLRIQLPVEYINTSSVFAASDVARFDHKMVETGLATEHTETTEVRILDLSR